MTKQNMRRLRVPGQDNYVNNKIHKHPNLQLNLHISKRIFLSQKREGGQVWLLDLRLDSGLAPRAGGVWRVDSGLAPRTRGSGGWIRGWPPEQGGLEAGFGAGPPSRGGLEGGFGAGPPNKGVWRLDSRLAPRTGGSGGWIRG